MRQCNRSLPKFQFWFCFVAKTDDNRSFGMVSYFDAKKTQVNFGYGQYYKHFGDYWPKLGTCKTFFFLFFSSLFESDHWDP